MRPVLLTLLLAVPAAAQTPPSADAVLRAVDAVRAPDEANLVQRLTIQARDRRGAQPAARYEVRTRRGSGSLVTALDGDGRGQKYLSTPAGFWFYAPRTRQAIRLTPVQLLRGQASVGDISRIQFVGDYRATVRADGAERWRLDMTAASPLATYAKIVLLVERDGNRPLSAELYAAAGRLLKTVRFGPVMAVSGRRLVGTTTYVDGLDPARSTVVTVGAIDTASTPAALYRPQALAIDR